MSSDERLRSSFVSVIIPMYNEAGYIRGCMDSLIEQDYPSDLYEIIVVDGLSNDGSIGIVRQYCEGLPNVSVLENPQKITPVALNIGVEHAKGEIILILGAHSSVDKDFLSKNVQTLKTTNADCVGGTIEAVGESFVGKAIAAAVSHPFGVGNAQFRYSKKAQYVDTVAFGAYKREVFQNIGGFDETLDTNQDYEFNCKLRNAGGKIFLNPEIRPRYYSRNTLWGLMKQYFRYGIKKIAVVRKHPKAFQFRYKIPPLFILALFIAGVLGFFHPVFHYFFAAAIGSYAVAVFSASMGLFFRFRKPYALFLPVVFVVLHFSFGLGFLFSVGASLLRVHPKNRDLPQAPKSSGV